MEDRDYGYAGADTCDPKPLESIASIAEESERTVTLISSFILRFRNGISAPDERKGSLAPVPGGHAGQIDRLREAVAECNKLARELGSIG